MRSLLQVLLDYDLPLLRAIAWYWDHEVTSKKPREAAEQLAAAMSLPETAAHVWHDLPEPARAALSALVAAGGRMPSDLFFRRFGALEAIGPGRLEREERWRSPANIAEGLWYRGLIARAFEATPTGPEEFAFIPRELLPLLPVAEQETAVDPPGGVAPEPTHARMARSTLVDDITTLLAYLQVNPAGAAAHSGTLADKVGPHLTDPDRGRLDFAWYLMLDLHLASVRTPENGPARLRPDAAHARPWMEAERSVQLRALADAWRAGTQWNDLHHVQSLECEDTGWRNDPLRARTAILRHLAAVPADTWWSLPEFVQAIKARDPDFQRNEYESWYIHERVPGEAPGAYLRGFEAWEQVEGALIAHIVQGPLHWLGLADLDVAAFRLNARGAAFVRGAAWGPAEVEPVPSQAASSIHVRPDATIEVPSTVSRYGRFQVARVADWLRAGEPYVYRLSPGSLVRAQAQGISVERLVDFLGRQMQGPLPISVRDALRRWEELGVEINLVDAVVLRVEAPGLLEQLLGSPRTARFIQEPLGTHAALVRAGDVERLAAAIRELGYLVQKE